MVGRGRPSERVSLLHRRLVRVLFSGVVRRVHHAADVVRHLWACCADNDCSKPSVLVLLLCGFSVSWVGAVSGVLLVVCLWVSFQEARWWQRHIVLQERWYWFACLRCWLLVGWLFGSQREGEARDVQLEVAVHLTMMCHAILVCNQLVWAKSCQST